MVIVTSYVFYRHENTKLCVKNRNISNTSFWQKLTNSEELLSKLCTSEQVRLRRHVLNRNYFHYYCQHQDLKTSKTGFLRTLRIPLLLPFSSVATSLALYL